MSDKPHTVAVGAFVAGALLIALTTLLFMLGSGFGSREKVVMVFDGSVTGLNVGAPLAIRGVEVGQVTNIDLILHSDTVELIMLVEAEFNPSAIKLRGPADDEVMEELIKRGLRAQLNTQSLLTGLLFIQLDFHPNSKLVLRDIDSPYFQLPTVPTDLERITRKLQDIDLAKLAENVDRVAANINTVVDSEEFHSLPARLNGTLASLEELSEQLQQQLENSGPKLDSVLDQTAVTMASAEAELSRLGGLVEQNLAALDTAIAAFERTMNGVEGVVAEDSATLYQLNRALQELTRAGRSLQSLADTLDQHPESILRGRRGDSP